MSFFSLTVCLIWSTFSSVNARSDARNVIFFLADDLGWGDVGFHGSGQVLTPTIDGLASQAIVLDNYYTNPICSPSRGALLTGAHPVNASMQNYVIGTAEPRGLPLHLELLPQYLSKRGYKSHLIGKWHLGFYKKEYTPTQRGFDSHFGYWTGEIGYYDHTALEDGGFWGTDMRDGMNIAVNHTGTYTTELFTERAKHIIEKHDARDPLFLLMSYQSVHSGHKFAPLEAPERLVRQFPAILDENRKTFAAMLLAMDQSIAAVMHSLQSRDLLKNSIVIFASDNGAAVNGMDGSCGSNWPLRGSKFSLWEGGIRVPAFIWSPDLKARVSMDFFHVTDWLPTLLTALHIPSRKVAYHIYGVDQWQSLIQGTKTQRMEILHNIDPIWNVSSIRSGRFKLVQGLVMKDWQGWFPPPTGRHNGHTFVSTRIDCGSQSSCECVAESALCLFDIETDPCEKRNVADLHPQVVRDLWQRIQDLGSRGSPAGRRPRDVRAGPAMHGYAWSCWQDEE